MPLLRVLVGTRVLFADKVDQSAGIVRNTGGTVESWSDDEINIRCDRIGITVGAGQQPVTVAVRRRTESVLIGNKKYRRRQFPLLYAHAMTIHRAQGQTIDANVSLGRIFRCYFRFLSPYPLRSLLSPFSPVYSKACTYSSAAKMCSLPAWRTSRCHGRAPCRSWCFTRLKET